MERRGFLRSLGATIAGLVGLTVARSVISDEKQTAQSQPQSQVKLETIEDCTSFHEAVNKARFRSYEEIWICPRCYEPVLLNKQIAAQ